MSSLITYCIFVENALTLCGDFTVSSWITHYLLVESSMYYYPRGDLTVSLLITNCFSSWRTCCDVFFVFWIARRFFVSFSGLLPLDQYLLVMLTLRSDFIDYCKLFVCLLNCSPWNNISWWFRRYGQNYLLNGNLLLSSSCLVATLIVCFYYYGLSIFLMLSQIIIIQSLYNTAVQY